MSTKPNQSQVSYNILDLKEPTTNIITDIRATLFIYLNEKKETLSHIFYIDLMQGKSVIRQISISNRDLNGSLSIVKAILTANQLRALMKSKRGDLFNETHRAQVRQKILVSKSLERDEKYISQHHNFSENDIKEYAISLLV